MSTFRTLDQNFDCQNVISMSLEKISGERKRRNGANLHRSLMICDLLVRLRSHLLSETSQVPPTEVAPAEHAAMADADSDVDTECDTLESASQHEYEKDVQDIECDRTQHMSQTVETYASQQCEYAIDASERTDSQQAVVCTLLTDDQASTQLCDRERTSRKRRYAVLSEEDMGDSDKRCRLVPESSADCMGADSQPDAQSAPLGYIAVPITVLNAAGNTLPFGLDLSNLSSYFLNGSVLLAYPTQLCAPVKSLDSIQLQHDATSVGMATENNMPLVFVIN